MLEVTNLKNGQYFEVNGQVFEVLKYAHSKLGRGKANIKVKVRNLLNGAITEKVFASGKKVVEADLEKKKADFKYRTREGYVFQDEEGEDWEIALQKLGDKNKFLDKGMTIELVLFKGEPVTVELPIKVSYQVKEAPPDVRGNSATASYKEVVLENNLRVKAPMFIKEGERIMVDTRNGEYVARE